jgi:NitT/TauT family transport system substrate-binding protein
VNRRRSFLAGAAALCFAAPSVVRAQQLVQLTIGDPPSDPGITPVVGIRTGIYRRYGIDLTIQVMASGAATSAAVAGGALHVGGSSLMGLINAHVRGIPFQIVAPASVYVSDRAAEALVVRKDAPIRTAADLTGKTVASPALGDLLSTATMAWIDANGGNAKLVHQVELPPSATAAALESGRIDAAAIQEPRLTELLRSGNSRMLGKPYDVIGKRFLNAATIATADFINANRDTIERFARATLEVNAYANAHPDQTAPWLAEFAKVPLDAVLHSTRAIFAESISVPDVQLVVDAAARFKIIERPFDARELISPVVLPARA